MKTKGKLILSSLAMIAVAGGIAGGATYALFTDNNVADVAITSGKVKVSTSISDLKTYSIVPDSEGTILDEFGGKYSQPATNVNGVFTNGGTTSYDSGNNLVKLDKVTPGDKATFNLAINNFSNVTIKYRVNVIKVTPEGVSKQDSDILFSGLKITVGDKDLSKELTYKTDWTVVNPTEQTKIFDETVSIELPADAGNIYQNKSTSIRINVEAVQANADTSSVKAYAKNANKFYETVDEAINEAEEGEYITILNDDLYHKGEGDINPIADNITIDLNNNVLRMQKDSWFICEGLTIKNGFLKGELDGQSYALFVGDDAHSSVTLTDVSCLGGLNFYNCTATVNNCSTTLVAGYCSIWADQSDVTINGGFYDGRNRNFGHGVVGASSDSTLTINGGLFLDNSDKYFVSTWENDSSCDGIIVNEGTFNVNVNDFVFAKEKKDKQTGEIVVTVINEHQNVMSANSELVHDVDGLFTVQKKAQ